MSIKKIPGEGLSIDLKEFKPLRAFQDGGEFWEHQIQTVIREYMGEFLPSMQPSEDGESVLCQMFVDGKEVASRSRKADGIPSSERKRLRDAISKLKMRAAAPDVDSNTRRIIDAFKLPAPRKDPELYRLYGSKWRPKVMVVWGCEKEEGTSVVPELAGENLQKESNRSWLFRNFPWLLLPIIILGLFVWWISSHGMPGGDHGEKSGLKMESTEEQQGGQSRPDQSNSGNEQESDTGPLGTKPGTGGEQPGGSPQSGDAKPGTGGEQPGGSPQSGDAKPGTGGDQPGGSPQSGDAKPGTEGKAINDGHPENNNTNQPPATGAPSSEDKDTANPKRIIQVEEGPITLPKNNKPSIPISRKATGDEVNLAKLIRPAVVTVAVKGADGNFIGQGSGFLITNDGIVVTNSHVIKNGNSFFVVMSDGTDLPVETVIANDANRDLALLKLRNNGRSLPFLALTDGESGQIGEHIAVMGTPHGLSGTFTTGIVSAKRTRKGDVRLLQITAPVSPGSSGSPVVSRGAEVVGIVSGGIVDNMAQSLNFAIDVGELRELLQGAPKTARKSISKSTRKKAANTRDPKKVPVDVALPKPLPGGGKVEWPKPQRPGRPDAKGQQPTQQSGRIMLEEIKRRALDNGNIQVDLRVILRKDNGTTEELRDVGCVFDGKRIQIVQGRLKVVTSKGTHRIEITGKDAKGNEYNAEANLGVNVKIESTIDIQMK